MRTSLLILSLAIAISSAARSVWHETPAAVAAGFHFIDSFAPAERAVLHVRLSGECTGPLRWGIVWDYQDDNNYMRATLSLPAKRNTDDIYSSQIKVEVEEMRQGALRTCASRTFTDEIDAAGGMNSLKLMYAGGCATLYAGADSQREVATVDFDALNGGAVAYFCDAPVKVQRIDASFVPSSDAVMSPYPTIEALAAHLQASTDAMEGFWEYLDRNLDTSKAALGGKYLVATVANPKRGGYDIVYIKGSEMGAWKPMQIKGHLSPTIFVGNYDMEWITAQYQIITDDANAQLSDDKAILSLFFPDLDSQVRLRRKLINR